MKLLLLFLSFFIIFSSGYSQSHHRLFVNTSKISTDLNNILADYNYYLDHQYNNTKESIDGEKLIMQRMDSANYLFYSKTYSVWMDRSYQTSKYNWEEKLSESKRCAHDYWNNSWENRYLDQYSYDWLGNLTTEINYQWYQNNWDPHIKQENYYNNFRLDSMISSYHTSYWLKFDKTEYKYDSTGQLSELISHSGFWNNQWETIDDKVELGYDSAGNIIEMVFSYPDTSNNTWFNFQKIGHNYDANGNMLSTTKYNNIYDNGSWNWMPEYIIEWEYSATDKITERRELYFTQTYWDTTEIWNYTYGSNDEIIDLSQKTRYNNSWLYKFKYTYFQNVNHPIQNVLINHNKMWFLDPDLTLCSFKPDSVLVYSWDTISGWVDFMRYYYHYSSINSGLDEAQNSSTKIYPNPTKGNITIELSEYTHGSLRLFTSSGKEVFSKKINFNQSLIDLTGIKPGVYIYQIETSENKISGRIIVLQ